MRVVTLRQSGTSLVKTKRRMEVLVPETIQTGAVCAAAMKPISGNRAALPTPSTLAATPLPATTRTVPI